MSYNELREDLIAFEKANINKILDEQKRKIVTFKATTYEEGEELRFEDEIDLNKRTKVDRFTRSRSQRRGK